MLLRFISSFIRRYVKYIAYFIFKVVYTFSREYKEYIFLVSLFCILWFFLFETTTFPIPSINRPYALEIIQEIELYLFSPQFNKGWALLHYSNPRTLLIFFVIACYNSEMVTVKYSLFALHVWLVKNRLSSSVLILCFVSSEFSSS